MGTLWGDGGHWTTTIQAPETNDFVQGFTDQSPNSHAFTQQVTSRYPEENIHNANIQFDNVHSSHHVYDVAHDFVDSPATFLSHPMQQSSNVVYFGPLHMDADQIEESTQFIGSDIGIQTHNFNATPLNNEMDLSNVAVNRVDVDPTNVAPLPFDVMKPGEKQFTIATAQPTSLPVNPIEEVEGNASYKGTAASSAQILRRRTQRPRTIHATLYTCGIPGCGKTFTLQRDLARHQVYSRAHEEFRSFERWICTKERCNNFGKTFTRQDNYQRHVRMYHKQLIHDSLETQNSSAG